MARWAYWTILVGDAPTAFRAHLREDLLPTFRQLQRTQPTVRLCWFERGRIWTTQEEAQQALERETRRTMPRRGREWRPGGQHKDPKARYQVPRDVKRARFKARARRGPKRDDPA